MKRHSSIVLIAGKPAAIAECLKSYGPSSMSVLIGLPEIILQAALGFFVALLQITTTFVLDELEQALSVCYKLPASSCKLAANSIKAAVAWVKYKVRCSGSGKFMAPWLKQLKDSCFAAESPSAGKPERRLRRKTSLTEDTPSSSSGSADNPFMSALNSMGGLALFSSSGLPIPAKQEADVISLASTVLVDDIDVPIPLQEHPVLSSRAVLAQKTAAKKVVEYWDAAAQSMARLHKGQTIRAKMEAGSDGFQVAVWPDGARNSTEQPNALVSLEQAKEALKAPAAMKKPAAASKQPAATPLGGGMSQPAAGFCVMRYLTGAMALRETTGQKKQLWQISDKKKTDIQLRKICCVASHKIASGEMSKEASKVWAKAQL